MGEHKRPRLQTNERTQQYWSQRLKEFLGAPDVMWEKVEKLAEKVKVQLRDEKGEPIVDNEGKPVTVNPPIKQSVLFFLDSFVNLAEAAEQHEKAKKAQSESVLWTPDRQREVEERLANLRRQVPVIPEVVPSPEPNIIAVR